MRPAAVGRRHADLAQYVAGAWTDRSGATYSTPGNGYWRFVQFGNTVIASSPEEFDAFFKADVAKFAKVVKDSNIPQLD